MATEGIEGLYIETRNYGATASFWASLGFTSAFETDHGSGQWIDPGAAASTCSSPSSTIVSSRFTRFSASPTRNSVPAPAGTGLRPRLHTAALGCSGSSSPRPRWVAGQPASTRTRGRLDTTDAEAHDRGEVRHHMTTVSPRKAPSRGLAGVQRPRRLRTCGWVCIWWGCMVRGRASRDRGPRSDRRTDTAADPRCGSRWRTVGRRTGRAGRDAPARWSRHLKVLRDAGLVEVRRDAQRRLYRLRPEPLWRSTHGSSRIGRSGRRGSTRSNGTCDAPAEPIPPKEHR